MKKASLVALFIFFLGSLSLAQDQKLNNNITDKAVIGFPSITNEQLNQVKTEFQKYPQIQQAVYVYGTYNCMLIKLDLQGTTFKQFYDFLKPLSEFYDINQCYVKPYEVYDFIEQNKGITPTFIIKP